MAILTIIVAVWIADITAIMATILQLNNMASHTSKVLHNSNKLLCRYTMAAAVVLSRVMAVSDHSNLKWVASPALNHTLALQHNQCKVLCLVNH